MLTADNFLDIADLLPEPMFLINRQGKVVAANTAALQTLDYPVTHEFSFYDAVHDPRIKVTEYLRACFRSADLVLGAVNLRTASGHIIATRLEGCIAQFRTENTPALILLRCVDKRKSNARFLELTHKLDELARERMMQFQATTDLEELQRLALIDALTSLPNRRSLDKNLGHEWKRAIRDAQPISAILLDIDNFKAFNDTYGHLSGDGCIREVARAVQVASQRPADLTARYGGEEFAVLLPSTQREGALIVAERIRLAVEELGILHRASSTSDIVTVSLGVATIIPSTDSAPLELLANADKALYQAKGNGKNCVCVHGRGLADANTLYEHSIFGGAAGFNVQLLHGNKNAG